MLSLLASALLLKHAVSAQTVPLKIPLMAPSNAVTLDPALVSFSIEQDRWPEWAGTDAPNTFFLNALGNLAKRTGTPPWLRIGADSADITNFSNHVNISETIFPAHSTSTPYPEASNITVGAHYYSLAARLPRGTRVIWGVNFGTLNLTAAFLEARAIKDAFESEEVQSAGVTLEALEIGNEVDIYGFTGHRNESTWTVPEYVKEWTEFAANISVTAGVSDSGPHFLGLSFGIAANMTPFSPESAFANGILNSTAGKLINEISQHKYSNTAVGVPANLPSLMSKATIRSNLSALTVDISAVHDKGLEYILGETNSYFMHGAPGVSNAAGAAIWAIDYTLFAASLGIKRAHFHEGIGYAYNFIQPVTLSRSIIDGSPLLTPTPPHIQPAYYGALVVAEVIGITASKVVELSILDPTIAGYSIYGGGKLEKVVLINSQAFLSTSMRARAARNVTLSFGSGTSPKSADVKRLVIGYADDTAGIVWGGQSFETSDASPSGSVKVETINVSAGVKIHETEAVLLTFH